MTQTKPISTLDPTPRCDSVKDEYLTLDRVIRAKTTELQDFCLSLREFCFIFPEGCESGRMKPWSYWQHLRTTRKEHA